MALARIDAAAKVIEVTRLPAGETLGKQERDLSVPQAKRYYAGSHGTPCAP